MTKTEIIRNYIRFNQWVQSLESISKKEWFQPMQPGKWSIAEVIVHLTYWDRYFLKERFPFMKQGASLPRPIDVDVMNQRASLYAKSGVTEESIVNEFMETRDLLINAVNARAEEDMDDPFKIRGHDATLRKYLISLCEHDRHHKLQVEDFLNETRKTEDSK
ncbi:DinB family protein [Alkalihalobacillus sp. AL-G]|uniref:DinB family protein n=1 Tax=Alkalihalobacillus sp. AL-G TaxID=2926399 RepID=UPI00272CF125|nr:DinB family protein [Alkalihalobacillus sp. AL-G]WLD94253.1 DinB family protein [Alkalihalobacillus sp. AL-G]